MTEITETAARSTVPTPYQPVYLADYQPPVFYIPTTRLEFDLDPQSTRVTAQLQIQRNLKLQTSSQSPQPLVLQGEQLQLQYIKLNGEWLPAERYQLTSTQLILPTELNEFTLELTVTINPSANSTCSGLYISQNIFCTQNEPQGFRRICYFLDRPDVLTQITTVIRADRQAYPVLLSNGHLLAQRELPDGRQEVVWQDPFKKACYLFALVAGNLAWLAGTHRTPSQREIQLRIYTAPERIDQAQLALASLQQAMQWDEEQFNLECDLDLYQVVAIDDFNFGAMENKGLNIFNSRLLLASPQNATDSDRQNITRVIAHEYFHNWTGNRVTGRDWFQVGLKEGLTTLRENLFMEDSFGVQCRLDAVKWIQDVQFKDDASPLAHPVRLASYLEVNNVYTSTVYEKSAELFGMTITLFGREGFRRILTNFLRQMDGQAATISDFWQVATATFPGFEMDQRIQPHYSCNLQQLEAWYDCVGSVQLTAQSQWQASAGGGGHLQIGLAQQRLNATATGANAAETNLIVPVQLELLYDNAQVEQPTEQLLLLLTKDCDQFLVTPAVACANPSAVVYLSGFSAPVLLQADYNDDQLELIIQASQDSVNRQSAMQELLCRALMELIDNTDNEVLLDQPLERLPAMLQRVHKLYLQLVTRAITLAQQRQQLAEANLLVRMLHLPSLNYLIEQFAQRYNLFALRQATRNMQCWLGQQLQSQWQQLYSCTEQVADSLPEFTQCTLRELNALALRYLLATDPSQPVEPELAQLVEQRFQQSYRTNITNLVNLLDNAIYWQWPQAQTWLTSCFADWQADVQLFNKWLAFKGRTLGARDEAKWQAVCQLPGFSWQNPNNVLALFGNFCTGNLTEFHAADGGGYQRVAQAVLKLDAINPQIAALLAVRLSNTKGLPAQHKSYLQTLWQRLLNQQPPLSVNVYEIIYKANQAQQAS